MHDLSTAYEQSSSSLSLQQKQEQSNIENDENNSNAISEDEDDEDDNYSHLLNSLHNVLDSESVATAITTATAKTNATNVNQNNRINVATNNANSNDKNDNNEGEHSVITNNTEAQNENSISSSSSSNNVHICYAPAGTLGVIVESKINNNYSNEIDDDSHDFDNKSTMMIPTITKIKKGSVLQGMLNPYDQIIAIDDINTMNLKAVDVMQIMKDKSHCTRKITIMRPANNNAKQHLVQHAMRIE